MCKWAVPPSSISFWKLPPEILTGIFTFYSAYVLVCIKKCYDLFVPL